MSKSRCLLFCSALILWVIGAGSIPASADDIHLTASCGLGGWYRPGGWNPISVTVQNTRDEPVTGQLQVKSWGQSIFNSSETPVCLFARPVAIPGSSSQKITVYTRGIDSIRDRLKLSFAEGQERGDGRLLAQLDNDSTNSNLALTAMPLRDNSLLLAGFAGSPGVFQSLQAQTVGLTYYQTGNRPPHVVQLASLVSTDLPDRAAGYGAVTAFMIRGDAPVDALTEVQVQALKGWVAYGGHLVVFSTGNDPNLFASSFYQDILPATIGSPAPDGRLTLIPRTISGIQIIQHSPDIITAPYGNGRVTVTNFDPWSTSASHLTNNIISLWRTLLPEKSSYHFLARMVENDENINFYYWGSNQPKISDTVKPSTEAQTHETEMIGFFLMCYLSVLVLGSYLIIRKTGRKQLVWVIIPLGTLLFSGATFGIGYAANSGSVFVNRASVIEANSGQRKAGEYAALGLYSPSRASFDLNVSGENSLVALPIGANEIPRSSLIKFVQKPIGTNILDFPVNMGDTHPLEMQSTIDLGGPITFSSSESVGIAGMITNHSNFDLTDCQVYYRGLWQPVGTLKQGGWIPIIIARRTVNPASEFELPQTSNISPDDVRFTSRRMRFELDNYLRSLGRQETTFPDEAVLFGWCDNSALAGPPVIVDGHPVQENTVSLVIVHLAPGGK